MEVREYPPIQLNEGVFWLLIIVMFPNDDSGCYINGENCYIKKKIGCGKNTLKLV